MTIKELNRDIKRLWKEKQRLLKLDDGTYYDEINGLFRAEFLRLYHADHQCQYMNLQNFRIMYRLNQCHKFVPFHIAWINLEIK